MPAKTISITLTDELTDLLAKVRKEGEHYRSDEDVIFAGLHEVAERDRRERDARATAAEGNSLFISYTTYLATGEGYRRAMAVAGSAEHAHAKLIDKSPAYFQRGIVTTPLTYDFVEEFHGVRMADFFPKQYREKFKTFTSTAGDYYQEFYFNLS